MSSVLPCYTLRTTSDVVIFAFDHQASLLKLKNSLRHLLIRSPFPPFLRPRCSEFLCYFLFVWKTFFSYAGKAGLLVTNSISFSSSANVFISPLFPKDRFNGHRILGWPFSSFYIWNCCSSSSWPPWWWEITESSVPSVRPKEEMWAITTGARASWALPSPGRGAPWGRAGEGFFLVFAQRWSKVRLGPMFLIYWVTFFLAFWLEIASFPWTFFVAVVWCLRHFRIGGPSKTQDKIWKRQREK